MVKWKGALFIIVTVIVALLLSVGADVMYGYVATTKIEPPTVAHANFEYKAENEYLGNKIYDEDGVLKSAFDVREVLSLSAEDDLKVSINGVSNGDFVDFADVDASEVTISVNGRNVRLVDGVNVRSAADFLYDKSTYSYLSNNLVLQNDIDLNLLPEESRDVTFKMKHDIFGNGKSIISAKRTGEKARYFGVSIRFIGYGQNVVDTRFSGKTVSAGEEVVLDDFLYCGIPVEIGNGKKSDAKFVEKTKANFTNCVFENSYRNVAISRSDVEFVRCVFNNAAEANVSLKTTTGNNSTLTFKDSVIANSNVAGIMNWCDEIVEESSYCTINILNTKFYCWKSSDSARVMVESGNGDFYKTVNSVFQAVINNGNAKKNLVECNGKYYFSSSIFVICSKSGGKNAAKLNGLYENHLQKSRYPKTVSFRRFCRLRTFTDTPTLRSLRPTKNRNIVIDAKICAFFNVAFKTSP